MNLINEFIESDNNLLISEKQSDEENDYLEISEQRRKIFTEQGDPEIESLYRRWKDGDLDIQPEFQRGFVWDIKKASRLIESIFLDIPLPVIYLSQEKDGKEYVIDGQQRLTSFFSFIDGKLPDPELPYGKDFRLTNLNVFTELNGKFYKDLPLELQKKIRYYKVRTITFRKESEKDLKFEVFERLNTGSVSLNDQELRNCIYRGKYNDLLWELSEDKCFRELLGINKPERRMRDVELVLRFAAFYHSSYLNYKPPMKKFLNEDMEKYRNISDNEKEELRNAFKNSISIINSLLGKHAFKRFYAGTENNKNGYWEKKKFNASLYDILMYSFARRDKNLIMNNLELIREEYINLMTSDEEFIDSIELSTSSRYAVYTRFHKWEELLDTILGNSMQQQIYSLKKIKEELYKQDPTCSICNHQIVEIDDAVVNQNEIILLDGKTVPENGRLTHRYCDNIRKRNKLNNVNTNYLNNELAIRKRKPKKIKYGFIKIDNEEIFCKSNIEVLINVSNWLIKNGYLDASKCPVRAFENSTRCIINSKPLHPSGSNFLRPKLLLNNLFLECNFSANDCLKWSKFLLYKFGILPNRFNLDD